VSRDGQERLRDIQEAIAAIRQHLDQADETAAAREDALLHDALLFQFVVIGEAVKHLSPETRKSRPDIPWADIAGLRDLIAHEYFRITSESIFIVCSKSLSEISHRLSRPSPACSRNLTDPLLIPGTSKRGG
jgi:uncharacterized protein with HEPN domain